MKTVAGFALCLLVTADNNLVAQAPQPEKPPEKGEVKYPALLSRSSLPADGKDDDLRKLLKARYNEALSEARAYYEMEQLARRNAVELDRSEDDRYRTLQRMVQAGLDVFDTPAEKFLLLTRYLDLTREIEKNMKARYEVGRVSVGSLHRARYERLDAEVRLLRAKRAADRAKDR